MFQTFNTPPVASPLSPLVWRLVIAIYMLYVAVCLVIIAWQIASHHLPEVTILIVSMINGLIVLNYLWTGVETNAGGSLPYKKSPMGFWSGVIVNLAAMSMFFFLGCGYIFSP